MLTQVLSTEEYCDARVGPETGHMRAFEGPPPRPRAGRPWLLLFTALAAVSGFGLFPGTVGARAPAPLSRDHTAPDVRSTAGSGIFGRWFVDGFGLPAYSCLLYTSPSPRDRS